MKLENDGLVDLTWDDSICCRKVYMVADKK